LEMTGKAKKGQGIKMATQILVSGKAFAKFKQIIEAQKGSLDHLKLAKFKTDITAKRNSEITEIDNKKINSLGRMTGCPIDKSAGLYLHKHVSGKLKKGEKIITIYAESKSRLRDSLNFYNEQKPIILKNN